MIDPRCVAVGVSVLLLAISALLIHKWKKKKDEAALKGTGQSVGGALLTLFIVILFIGIAVAGMWLTFKRYSLISTALESGRGDIAWGLMAPEIGQGVSSVIRGKY